jgi:hypothetical protein
MIPPAKNTTIITDTTVKDFGLTEIQAEMLTYLAKRKESDYGDFTKNVRVYLATKDFKIAKTINNNENKLLDGGLVEISKKKDPAGEWKDFMKMTELGMVKIVGASEGTINATGICLDRNTLDAIGGFDSLLAVQSSLLDYKLDLSFSTVCSRHDQAAPDHMKLLQVLAAEVPLAVMFPAMQYLKDYKRFSITIQGNIEKSNENDELFYRLKTSDENGLKDNPDVNRIYTLLGSHSKAADQRAVHNLHAALYATWYGFNTKANRLKNGDYTRKVAQFKEKIDAFLQDKSSMRFLTALHAYKELERDTSPDPLDDVQKAMIERFIKPILKKVKESVGDRDIEQGMDEVLAGIEGTNKAATLRKALEHVGDPKKFQTLLGLSDS